VQLPYCNTPTGARKLWEIIGESLAILWKEWPRDMRLSRLEQGNFVLQGECPHCRAQAAFPTVTLPHEENEDNLEGRWIAAAQCIACNKYILAIIKREDSGGFKKEVGLRHPLSFGHPKRCRGQGDSRGHKARFQRGTTMPMG
jgi:Zn ribbon nucleic-acid-binding protein